MGVYLENDIFGMNQWKRIKKTIEIFLFYLFANTRRTMKHVFVWTGFKVFA